MPRELRAMIEADWRRRGGNASPEGVLQYREIGADGLTPVEGDDNLFDVSFSSETPVSRWFGDEILGHGESDSIDLSPLVNVGSVLFNHDMDCPVAVPVDPRIDTKKRRGTARIRFVPNDPESAAMKVKVDGGLVRGISVGYSVQKYLFDEEKDEARAVAWRVHEISLVTVPADASVGVGRSIRNGIDPAPVSGAVNPRQGATAMKHKLKDGRELTLAEIEAERRSGKDVVLENGDILPALETRAATPPPVPGNAPGNASERSGVIVVDRIADEARRKREEREAEIKRFVANGKRAGVLTDIDAEAYELDDRSADDIRKEILGKINERKGNAADAVVIGATRGNTPGQMPITVGQNRDIESMAAAIPQSLLMRFGTIDRGGRCNGKPLVLRGKELKVHERAESLSGFTIVELAREFLEAHGLNCRGKNKREIMVMAMGTNGRAANTAASFATLLENALNQVLYIGYETAPTTWREFCGVIPANDLRAHPLYKKGVFGQFARVGDGGEVAAGSYPDGKKESLQPDSFARTFSLTEDAIINDRLGAFANIIGDMGQAAAFTVEDWVYYRILKNATMTETGGALFNSTAITTATGHNNLTTGAITDYTAASQTMTQKMAKQVAPDGTGTGKGRYLNLTAALGLFPPELAFTGKKMFADTVKLGGTNGESNPMQGLARPIVNGRLSGGVTVSLEGGTSDTANGSATAFYYLCDPRIMPLITVAFLDGDEAPEFMEAQPIDILGRQYRGVLRFGVAASEWRAGQKHAGA